VSRACDSCEGGLACTLERSVGRDELAGNVDVVVATVPDPVDSALDSSFDQAVDAIQQAIESDGFIRDRYWLPWTRRNADRNADRPSTRCHEHQPGVIIFRGLATAKGGGGGSVRAWRVVLLVGESPIWGVQQTALETALTQARRLAPGRPVKLLGPTFSGTIDSLVPLLCDQPGPARYTIVSGSATAITPDDFAQRIARRPCRDTQLSFRTTALPDVDMQRLFYQYLARLDGGKRGLQRVALLVESNTVYGTLFLGDRQSPSLQPRYVIQFPSHISRVRSEYEKEDRRPSAGDAPSELSIRRTLEYSLGQPTGESRDVVPALSPKTAVLVDLDLSTTLPQMCPNVDYVGILATDASDRLFLAHRIKEYCPDVRLFTFESDVSYAHQAFAADFTGMLIASRYDFSRRQVTQRHVAVRPFASDFSIGVYNATLQLFDPAGKVPRFAGEPDADAGIWISTISRGAFWPVAFIASCTPLEDYARLGAAGARPADPRCSGAAALRDDDRLFPYHRPRLGFVLLVAALAANAFVVWRYFSAVFGARDRSRWLGRRLGHDAPPIAADRDARWPRRLLALGGALLYLTVTAVYLLIAYLAVVWQVMAARSDRSWAGYVIAALVIVAVSALGAIAVDAISAVIARPQHRRSIRARALVALGTFTLLLSTSLAALFATRSWIAGSLLPHRLFFARAAYLTSGVSVFVPLLALASATAVLLLSQLQRMWWRLERESVALPVDHGLAPVTCALSRVLTWGGGGRRIVLTLLVAALVVFASRGFLHSLETRPWSVGFGVAFALLLYAIAVELGWFVAAWRAFDQVLIRVSRLDLSDPLRRLPRPFARDLSSQLYARPLRVIDLSAPVRALARLSRAHDECCSCAMSKRLTEAATQARRALANDLAHRVDVAALGSETQSRLAAIARELASWHTSLRDPGADERRCSRSRPFTASLEDFIAMETATYVFFVEMNLRNLGVGSVAALLLVLVAATAYPFEPHGAILTSVSGLIVATVAAVLYVLIRIERNDVLSHIAKTKPGKITWNWPFIRSILVYVVVPLLFVVVARVPELSQMLSNWLAPFPTTPP
jgi:hypothetical protein